MDVSEVRDDSRLVQPGDLFVAVPGAAVDGRRFIADAAARGAAVLVCEGDAPAFPGRVVSVVSARRALGIIAANRYRAAEALRLLAVTGTNGKTTVTYLLESILSAAGRHPGVIGTVSNRAAGLSGGARPASLTTPGALAVHRLFADMRDVGTTDVVLEATSHALDQGRLEGCRFGVAGLTNVTQDHLDYHGTMDRYFDAKALLFERLLTAAGVAVLFVDQEEGRRMRRRVRGAVLGVAARLTSATAAAGAGTDVAVVRAAHSSAGMSVELATPVGRIDVSSSLVGDYNLSNLVLAVGMAIGAGVGAGAIADGIARLPGVPGRLERVGNRRGVLCVVDYAHTPDALERAIAALRPLGAGRMLVVFGCGGDRDRTKRPLMGEIVARDGDVAIVTSDNPRTEDPAAILDMVVEGVRRQPIPELGAGDLASSARGFHREIDRRAAIRLAVASARPGDVLLIAGKGHEDYQILGTTKVHFDDREEAAAAFSDTGAGA
jgi:UDP-N-acetylmuramoyl-L-alanyl-D-glutamate--2,6-diaminopimelate ligase